MLGEIGKAAQIAGHAARTAEHVARDGGRVARAVGQGGPGDPQAAVRGALARRGAPAQPAAPGLGLAAVPAWKPPTQTPEEQAAEVQAARDALRAAILEAEARFMRFCYFPQGRHAALLLAVWAAVANGRDAFSFAPFVRISSPEGGCGKSLVMDLESQLVPGSVVVIDPTGPYLRETIGAGIMPICDEIDGLITRKDAGLRQIVAVFNACYRRGAGVGRVAGRTGTFMPIMFGGIDEGRPKLKSVQALFTRCFEVVLAKPDREHRPERYRAGDHEAAGRELGETLRDCVVALADELAAMRPQLPEGIDLRAADISEPMAAVCDLAGGDLPERIRETLAVILGDPGADGPPQSPGQLALSGLAAVWDGEEMTLPDITRRMMALPGAPWASVWTPGSAPRELAALLEGAGIIPAAITSPDGLTRLGLYRADVEHLLGE